MSQILIEFFALDPYTKMAALFFCSFAVLMVISIVATLGGKNGRRIIPLALLFLSAPLLAGPRVTFEFLDLFPEADWVRPFGINNAGDIAGTYYQGTSFGFIRRANGVITTLSVPGAVGTQASGIDDLSVVGAFSLPTPIGATFTEIRSFLYQNGQYTTFTYPLSRETTAYGVNQGRVVGNIYADDQALHGFLFQNGNWTLLDYPSSRGTFAYGINSAGKVFGSYWNTDYEQHGFTYLSGQYVTVDFPSNGVPDTQIFGGNNRDSIIGGTSRSVCVFDPFIITTGKAFLLDLPQAWVTGINDDGYIVGSLGRKVFTAKASAFILRK